MAYQAKKHKRYREDFELVDDSGNVVHTLYIDLDADDVVSNINRKYTAVVRAIAETEQIKRKNENNESLQDAIETLGRAEIDLIEAVFGEDNTGIIVEFFEGRYIEMAKEVIPFITTVAVPKITEIAKENKKQILSGYNRKQRRNLLKVKR